MVYLEVNGALRIFIVGSSVSMTLKLKKQDKIKFPVDIPPLLHCEIICIPTFKKKNHVFDSHINKVFIQ